VYGVSKILIFELWIGTSIPIRIAHQNYLPSFTLLNIKVRYNNDKQKCPRGEIGRHKGLKSRGIHRQVSPWESNVV